MGAPELFTGLEFSLPPPRVLVMGPPESGHLTLANTLASETAAVVQDLNKTITAVDHGTVAVSNRVVLSELNRHQLASQGVVSLGLPYLRVASTINNEGEEGFEEVRDPAEQMMALLEGGVYFDAVIVVTQADELAVERLLVQPTFDELKPSVWNPSKILLKMTRNLKKILMPRLRNCEELRLRSGLVQYQKRTMQLLMQLKLFSLCSRKNKFLF